MACVPVVSILICLVLYVECCVLKLTTEDHQPKKWPGVSASSMEGYAESGVKGRV